MYRYTFVGFANSYEEAKQLIINKYGKFDGRFAYIEML